MRPLIPTQLRPKDVVVGAGDFNAQLGYLAQIERQIGCPFSVPAYRADKSDCFIQACFDRGLFLAKTNLPQKAKSANLALSSPTNLNLDRSHGHREKVACINRRLSVTVSHW